MDVREKLVELFYENNVRCDQKIEGLADDVVDIIAHNVTVPQWISVKDKIPKNSGHYLVVHRNKYNGSISTALEAYIKCKIGEWWANDETYNVTYWMSLPQPPKGE